MRLDLRSPLRLVAAAVWLLSLAACSDQSVNANNSPPTATIDQPTVGTETLEGSEVEFSGTVQDPSTPEAELQVTWSSSLDGELLAGTPDGEGVTTFVTTELSPGTHTVTLQVRDREGASAQATVDLVVVADGAPTVVVDSPSAEGVHYSTLPVTLQATADDVEDLPADLRVSWAVDGGEVVAEDVAPDSTGLSTTSHTFEAGTYVLIVTATDTGGNTGTDTVTITVGPPNTSPTCAFTAPASESSFPIGDLVTFEGMVGDVDVPADWLSVSFESNVDGPLGESTPSTDGAVGLAVSSLTAATHTVTMSVADEVGGTCSAFIYVTISTPPTAQIDAPVAGTTVNDNETVPFAGVVADAEDAENNLAVEWSSSLGGSLGNSTPDSSGNVGLPVTGLTSGTHVITLTATDSVGLTGTDTLTLDVNASPTAPVVSITPATPLTTDALSVVIDTPSTDPDNGPNSITYTYEWSLNGNPAPAYSGLLTIPAVDTGTLQTWAVSVVAFDGLASSAPGAAVVAIGNSVPSVTSATVSPLVGLDSTVFTVTTSGWSDADGDPEGYTYQWYAGGAAVTGATSATFTPTGQAAGAALYCEVTPFDGTSPGLTVTSNTAAVNTPPGVSGVTISPPAGTEATTFTASFGATNDVDGQSVTVAWQWNVNGAPVPGATGSTLTGASFDKGQTVTVTATPNDGLENGAPVTSIGVTVDNTAPSITGVSISPTTGGENTTFTCNPTGWNDVDPADTTPAYTWQWTVAGAPSVTTQTITGASFDKGDAITCTATPTDGTTPGTPLTSAPVTIGNTAPSITGVSISPTSGGENTTFTCNPTGWNDVDPADTTPGYTWAWTVAGATSVTTQTITGMNFDSGDAIACTATPTDGTTPGTPVTSAPVTVANTPPSITGVTISPTTAYTNTLLTATPAGWSDADGDSPSYMYEWFSGTTAIGTDSPTLSGTTAFDKNESITVQVTPMDASSSGTPVVSSPVAVLNTAPTAPGVTITPSGATDANNLVCTVTTLSSDDDPGDTPTYTYAWLQNGASTSFTGSTLAAANTTAGETWTCEVTPNDGQANGPVGSDTEGPLASSCPVDVTAQGMTFVGLCGGTFNMGCTTAQQATGQCRADESPVHSVTLTKDFWMGETEVTQGQWQALMGNNPSYFSSCGANCPVDLVNWYEALELANALSLAEGLDACYTLSGCSGTLGGGCSGTSCSTGTYQCSSVNISSPTASAYDCEGYRVPTEAEWEYAARSGTDNVYSGSNSVGAVAWFSGNASSTQQVATKLANPWGLHDMSGNCWEWTADFYGSNYYGSSPSTDPEGPQSGSSRVYRGGNYQSPSENQRVSYRYSPTTPSHRSRSVGIRLARTVPVDGDGDGFFMYDDCDDTDPAIYPEAGDTYGDGVDSDCDGLDCEAASDGSTYFAACPDNRSWTDALNTCTASGYTSLATILSAAEHSFVQGLAVATAGGGGSEFWFGWNQIGLPESTWVFDSGLSSSYSNWFSGEPDDNPGSGGADCGRLHINHNYQWGDSPCANLLDYVCESR